MALFFEPNARADNTGNKPRTPISLPLKKKRKIEIRIIPTVSSKNLGDCAIKSLIATLNPLSKINFENRSYEFFDFHPI